MPDPGTDDAKGVKSWLKHELRDQFLTVNVKLDLLLEQVSIYAVHGSHSPGQNQVLRQWACPESGEGVPPVLALQTQELVRRQKSLPLAKPAASALDGAELPVDEELNDPPQVGISKNSAKTASVTWDDDSMNPEMFATDSELEGLQRGSMQAIEKKSTGKSQRKSGTSSRSSQNRPSLLTSMFGENSGPKGRTAITNILYTGPSEEEVSKHRFYFFSIWEFLEEPESSRAAVWYHKFMFALIIISCILNFCQTMQPPPLKGDFAIAMEVVFDAFFLIELALRFLGTLNKARFFCLIHNSIDFLGAFPPLVLRIISSYFMDNQVSENTRTALLCLVPVFRLLKMLRRWEKFNLLIFSGFTLVMEIMPVLIVMMFLMAFSFSSLIYFVEPESNIPDLSKALWLTIVTMTTVGYGDTVPKSTVGMYITLVLVISSALYMAVPLGIVGNAFSQVWEDRDWLFVVQQVRDRLEQNNYKAEDIPRLFKLFGGKSGELTLADFYRMIIEMRLGIKEDRVLKLFMSFDTDGSGTIDSIEFVRAIFPGNYADMYGRRCEEISSIASRDDDYQDLAFTGSAAADIRRWQSDWGISMSSRQRDIERRRSGGSYADEVNRRMHTSALAGTSSSVGSGMSGAALKHLALIEQKNLEAREEKRRQAQQSGRRHTSASSSDSSSQRPSGSLPLQGMGVTNIDSKSTIHEEMEEEHADQH